MSIAGPAAPRPLATITLLVGVLSAGAPAASTELHAGTRSQDASQDSAATPYLIDRRHEAVGATRATPGALYHHYCAHCHGPDGRGAGRLWPSELSPAPADLTQLAMSAAELADSIRRGTGARGKSNLCPPWERTLSDLEVRRLARHLTSPGERTAPAATTPPIRRRDPFPWLLALILVAQGAILWWMFHGRKEATDAAP